tara:strand:- start:162 stop:962 length:801 start_codon:yes stop_codon:yes gene_type:complete
MSTLTLNRIKILITGGGTGIGRACAEALARDGAQVTICGRREKPLIETTEFLNSAFDNEVKYVVADVTDEDSIAECMRLAAGKDEKLGGIVANAGGAGSLGRYHELKSEDFLKTLELNILGNMHCIKYGVPYFRNNQGGSFVGMSSIAAHLTHKFFGSYTVAKAGIDAMMRNAADEYGEEQFRFNSVRPGFIDTELMKAIPRESQIYKSYIDNTPLGNVGKAEDVANLVRFLLSEESRWITGQCITIDGGHSLRAGPDFSDLFTSD